MQPIIKFLFFFLAGYLLCLPGSVVEAKSIARKPDGTMRAWRPSRSPSSVAQLEQQLTPYFQGRIEGNRAYAMNVPTDQELFMVAQQWDGLSKEFKELYAAATAIPSWYVYYTSPGGNFQVHYAAQDTARLIVTRDTVSDTSDIFWQYADELIAYGDSIILVDSIMEYTDHAPDTTDLYGYGGTSGDWRKMVPLSNGVPDYIDEVAWALDSAWSMEIDRFQFPAPSSPQAVAYNVVVTPLSYGFYGMTFPGKRIEGSSQGYTSYMEVRHDWSGDEWKHLGYHESPELAVHATCVHEFFHAVQYAMAWNLRDRIYPDNYPLAWLEGTAVLMEEAAFPDIDDYIQYSRDYFYNATVPMLDDSHDPYFNCLLVMHLYHHTAGNPDIGFIRSVFTTSDAQRTDFYANLRTVSTLYGATWADHLNAFHTASFFSGPRADTIRFLPDAAKLPSWSYTPYTTPGARIVLDSIQPYAMGVFPLKRTIEHADSLQISFRGMGHSPDDPTGDQWAASVLLLKDDISQTETRYLTPQSDGSANLTIRDWHRYSGALVIATNGHQSERRYARVVFEPNSVASRVGDTLLIYPNPIRLSSAERTLKFEGKEITEVRVYRLDGTLVSRVQVDTLDGTLEGKGWLRTSRHLLEWTTRDTYGRSLTVGTYFFQLKFRNPVSGLTETIRRKLMITP